MHSIPDAEIVVSAENDGVPEHASVLNRVETQFNAHYCGGMLKKHATQQWGGDQEMQSQTTSPQRKQGFWGHMRD